MFFGSSILMRINPLVRRILTAILLIVIVVSVLSYASSPLALERHHVAGALAVASLICVGFALVGIYTGNVSAPRGRGRSLYTVLILREEDPLGFWVHVGLYLGAGLALLYWAIRVLAAP